MPDPRFFNNAGPFTVAALAELTGAELKQCDNPEQEITGVAPLSTAGAGDISFLENPKYAHAFITTKATACVVAPRAAEKAAKDTILLVTKNPYYAYARIAEALYPTPPKTPAIHERATIASTASIGNGCTIASGVVIEDNAEVGEGTTIGANAVVGRGVVIGKDCSIGANVTLSHALIGDRCILHPNSAFGQDGFGFALSDEKTHVKVPQLGRVVIGNDVEIGANSTIDRGSGPDTSIGDGTKIDNLVQIGHNAALGKHCVIVSQVGISGSTEVGDYVVLGGQVGISGHLKIGAGARVAAKSGVAKDIPPYETYGGIPAVPLGTFKRLHVILQTMVKESGKKHGN
jgi:UDP-3-O-[3-hydroxymyristoyl] glucosamine N-acyltransferase